MSGFAEYYESLDQIKCAEEDAFQIWFEEWEKDLKDEFEWENRGLSAEDFPSEDEFMKWAKVQFEQEKL